MKKILLLLILCVCFVFAGCGDVGTIALMQRPDGSVIEFYYVPYAEIELVEAGLSWDESEAIKEKAKVILNDTFKNYIDAYKARVSLSDKYTDEEKEILLNSVKSDNSLNYVQSTHITIGPEGAVTHFVIKFIQYELYFANKTAYLEFKNANQFLESEKEVVTEPGLFTTTTKVVKDPVFDNIAHQSLTLGQIMTQRFQETIVNVLAGENPTASKIQAAEARWETIKTKVGYDTSSQKFSYTYIVPTARLHSNADEVIYQDGYYYHVWEISANNFDLPDGERVQFEYWTITANKWVWYVTALLISGIVILTTYLIARKKEKDEIAKIKKEISLD